MHRTWFRIVALIVLGLIATTALQARGKKPPKNKKQPSFDYYMLVLSYAPDFCAQPAGDKDPRECGDGRQVEATHRAQTQGRAMRIEVALRAGCAMPPGGLRIDRLQPRAGRRCRNDAAKPRRRSHHMPT